MEIELHMENVIGKVYGKLTVIKEAARRGTRARYVVVRCSCEGQVCKEVALGNLKRGNTKSCGCLNLERATTHGLSKHHLYQIWKQMVQRCNRPSHKAYPDYGGRGITVCELWKSPEAFIADMQDTWRAGLSLDRKDNNKGYYKDNCRWATATEQQRNTRRNNNLTLYGKTQCLAAWSDELGISSATILSRLRAGKPIRQVRA